MAVQYKDIAVVGAGLAGIACARALAASGAVVTVFDKGRSVGGRISSRRTDAGGHDFGAQYFTATDPEFCREVTRWAKDGLCAPWPARVCSWDGTAMVPVTARERWVSVPTMGGLARALSQALDLRQSHRVDGLLREGHRWVVRGVRGEPGTTLAPNAPGELEVFGAYDAVVVCLPAPQIPSVLGELAPSLREVVERVGFEPCYAVGLVAQRSAETRDFDALFVNAGPLSWVAREDTKPGRRAGERWTLHASSGWSREHMDDTTEAVAEALVRAFRALPGLAAFEGEVSFVHRWRYARPRVEGAPGVLWDSDLGLGAAGDWALGESIEAAYLAGNQLAKQVRGA